jgi:hypothetical protein
MYEFMLKRRRFHKIFDAIKCQEAHFIIEKNGFAADKNLVLKDCIVSFEQLKDLTHLTQRVDEM